MEVLKITDITKNYGSIKALDNLSLTINKGEIYGLLGPNGSGKTTTLGIILGILKSNGGTYEWFSGKYKNPRIHIGAILETPNFYPYKSADENLDIIAKIKKVNHTNYDSILQTVDLLDRRKSKFSTYSLGMKQRLAIAATLIGDPEVLIFDEPTNGLDPQGIAEVRKILTNVAQSGRTVILASHILAEVEKICTHVAILKQGKLLAAGKLGHILSDDLVVELSATKEPQLLDFIKKLPWVKSYTKLNNYYECRIENNHTGEEINQLAFDQGVTLNHLIVRSKKLEEEFLEITKS